MLNHVKISNLVILIQLIIYQLLLTSIQAGYNLLIIINASLCILSLIIFKPLQSVTAGIIIVLVNNFMISISTIITEDYPNKAQFAISSLLFIITATIYIYKNRNKAFFVTLLGLVALITIPALLSFPVYGILSFMTIRNMLVIFLAYYLGFSMVKRDSERFVWIVSIFLIVNLCYQFLEILIGDVIRSALYYDMVLTQKGLGIGVFYSSIKFLGDFMRNGGIYLEPVNLSLCAGMIFAAILPMTGINSRVKYAILLMAFMVTFLSGGKGGLLVIALDIALLLLFTFISPLRSSLVVLTAWALGIVVSVIGASYLGELSISIAPHLWAIASIPDTLWSMYALGGHGYGSSSAFASIASESTLTDATMRGAESGLASYIYQGGLLWVATTLYFIHKNVQIPKRYVNKFQRSAYCGALIIPWIASVWQENSLSPQAVLLPYVLIGAIAASSFHLTDTDLHTADKFAE